MVPERDGHSDVLERQCVGRRYSKLFWLVYAVNFILHDLDLPRFAYDHHFQRQIYETMIVTRFLQLFVLTLSKYDFLNIFVININILFVPFPRLQWHVCRHVSWFGSVSTLSQQLPELYAVWYTDRSSRKLHTHVYVSIFQHGSRRFASGYLYLCLYMSILDVFALVM